MADYDLEGIARVCHEANRAWCVTLFEGGLSPADEVAPPWEEAPEWMREGAVAGVRFQLERPSCTPAESHEHWRRLKTAAGWVYGPIKDPALKRHPCMRAFMVLPPHQQAKDRLFQAVVRALAPFYQVAGANPRRNDPKYWAEI